MEVVNEKYLLRLQSYIKTFGIKYSAISKYLGLDATTVPKYFNGRARLSVKRYREILNALRDFAEDDELKLYLIDTWLKVDTEAERKQGLKRLCKELSDLSMELNDILG